MAKQKLVTLPNIRKLFIPDPGYTIFDCDLAGADAQVVAYEAEDLDLIEAFRKGLDVHMKNAEDLWGPAFTQLPGDEENGPKSRKRKECKQGVHATNYGATPPTLAKVLGWTNHEADVFQRRWFSIHPGIKTNFHGKVESSLRVSRTVTNRFGYRRVYFDRIDQCFTEALAWIPQSTVAEVSFRGALQLEEQYPQVEMLIQVHDSVVFQIPKSMVDVGRIKRGLSVPIPYTTPAPLVIQWGVSMSDKSWGDAEAA